MRRAQGRKIDKLFSMNGQLFVHLNDRFLEAVGALRRDLALLSQPKLYRVKIYNYVNMSKAKKREHKKLLES